VQPSVQKGVPNARASAMSNDGKVQASITRGCVQEKRRDSLFSESRILNTSLWSYKLLSTLKCTLENCGTIEKYTKLNHDFAKGAYYFRNELWVGDNPFKEFWSIFGFDWWSDLFPDDRKRTMCYNTNNVAYFLVHIDCFYLHCSSVNIHCKALSSDAGIKITNTYEWTGWITSGKYTSEEAHCPEDHFVIGFECDKLWCARMKLKCRKIEVCSL
jgi:hypothetical protein